MFDFLDSDWFNISLEILFLILVSWDIKKYIQTKKKEYITNIILTIAFAVWTLYPYYNSYFTWNEEEKKSLLTHCNQEKNTTLCTCIDNAIFKNYTHQQYMLIDKNATEFIDFLQDTTKECKNENTWF